MGYPMAGYLAKAGHDVKVYNRTAAKAEAWVAEHGVVEGFAGAEPIDGADVLTYDADVLIPAALEAAITEDNANDVKASVVVEAANGPTTPAAHELLHQRGITVVPDILANAGGVTVSYFEWSQNIQQFRWELERVVRELEQIMRRAYGAVADLAERDNLDLRTAAFVLAIKRVARAGASRHIVSHHLPAGLLQD